jgi:hypothetical protein
VQGTSLRLYLDNVLVTSATDSSIATGSVGLRFFNRGGFVDNFNAQVLDSTPTPPSPTDATLPFSDDFNRADGTVVGQYWTERNGNFDLIGGQITSTVADSSLVTVNGINAADVVVTANIDLGSSGDAIRSPGLVARYSGPGDTNMYVASLIYSNGQRTANLYKSVNGVWTQMRSVPITANAAVMRFEVQGTSLRLYLDNVLVTSATDSSIATGSVGLRFFNRGGFVDNFNASSI